MDNGTAYSCGNWQWRFSFVMVAITQITISKMGDGTSFSMLLNVTLLPYQWVLMKNRYCKCATAI